MKINKVLRIVVGVIVCVITGGVCGISYKDCTYRRASAGDLVAVLQVMNDIENSATHIAIPLYPYTMRAHYVEELINKKALFVATYGEEIVSLVAVRLLTGAEYEAYMTPCADESLTVGQHDIVLVSELWYTALPYRKRGVFTTLFGFALQSLVARLKSFMTSPSLQLHCIVDLTTDRPALNKKLLALSNAVFEEFVTAVQKHYFPHMPGGINISQTSCTIAQPFYNLFAHELEVAITRPAKRIVFSALVQ